MRAFLRRWYRWFLARNRLDLKVVCEESVGLPKYADYHDYDDTKEKYPDHFADLVCERCGKVFTI